MNDFAPGDAEYWAIVDGKLYLNYNKKVKNDWDADRALHISQADLNWPILSK
jgi:dTDP-4-dehydrorhamnose 3,5-epimerase-like enzyme